MSHGKKVCKILKDIRRQIAEKNDIAFITSECHFQGECKGTCPKCEAELRFLENELHKRKHLGKVATIAGISLGIATVFPACNQLSTPHNTLGEVPIEWDYKDDYMGGIDDEMSMFGISDTLVDYQGGLEALYKFLSDNIVYPKEARENKVEGTVLVKIAIEKDGSISEVKVLAGIGYGCDDEVVRVAKMIPNKWKIENIEKTVYYPLPVRFMLDDE